MNDTDWGGKERNSGKKKKRGEAAAPTVIHLPLHLSSPSETYFLTALVRLTVVNPVQSSAWIFSCGLFACFFSPFKSQVTKVTLWLSKLSFQNLFSIYIFSSNTQIKSSWQKISSLDCNNRQKAQHFPSAQRAAGRLQFGSTAVLFI